MSFVIGGVILGVENDADIEKDIWKRTSQRLGVVSGGWNKNGVVFRMIFVLSARVKLSIILGVIKYADYETTIRPVQRPLGALALVPPTSSKAPRTGGAVVQSQLGNCCDAVNISVEESRQPNRGGSPKLSATNVAFRSSSDSRG